VQVAVGMAISSGAQSLEAVALVSEGGPSAADEAVAAELGVKSLLVAGPDGTLRG
jgi:hypothetical protein